MKDIRRGKDGGWLLVLNHYNKEEITHTQLVQYAGASGDFNPIHTVVPFAESAGLGGVIAHGMMIMGFVGQAIGQWFPVKDLAKFSVRFKAMTRPGEKITVMEGLSRKKKIAGFVKLKQ